MIAARLANLGDGQRADRAQGAQICAPITQEQAGKMLNVSRRAVQSAKTVQKGIPELHKAVEQGEIAGIKPSFERTDKEPEALIVSANLNRRNMSKGQQAMALAMIYPEEARGKKRDPELSKKLATLGKNENAGRVRLNQARQVLRHSEPLAKQVLAGDLSLDAALSEVRKAEGKLQEVEKEIQSDEAQLRTEIARMGAELRAKAPDLADMVPPLPSERVTLSFFPSRSSVPFACRTTPLLSPFPFAAIVLFLVDDVDDYCDIIRGKNLVHVREFLFGHGRNLAMRGQSSRCVDIRTPPSIA